MQQLFRLLISLIRPYMFRATFAHPQEHFLTVNTAFGTMRRSAALYIKSKSAPVNGRICRPKHVGLN